MGAVLESASVSRFLLMSVHFAIVEYLGGEMVATRQVCVQFPHSVWTNSYFQRYSSSSVFSKNLDLPRMLTLPGLFDGVALEILFNSC